MTSHDDETINATVMGDLAAPLMEAKLTMVLVGCGVTAVWAVYLCVSLLRVRGVGVLAATSFLQWTCALLISLNAWFWTYDAMRVQVEWLVENRLRSLTYNSVSVLQRELSLAERITTHVAFMSNATTMTSNASFAEVSALLHSQWALYEGESREGIASIYFANRHGYSINIFKPRNVIAQWPQGADWFPPTWNCTSDAVALPSHSACLGHDFPPGAKFASAVDGYSLPPSAPPLTHTLPIRQTTYDPHDRPWYVFTPTTQWTTPYLFHHGTRVGITAHCGMQHGGEWDGVVAVDFDFESLQQVLLHMKPSEGSDIIMHTREGVLLGSTMDMYTLSNSTGLSNMMDVDDPRIALPAKMLRNNDILSNHISGGILIHGTERIIFSTEFDVVGLHVHITFSIPTSDMLGEIEKAATLSLTLVLTLTAVCVLFCVACTSYAIRPLRLLVNNMHQTAHMQLRYNKHASFRILEFQSMQDSFAEMVTSLVEYRQYLPGAVLADASDSEGTRSSNSQSGSYEPRRLSSILTCLQLTKEKVTIASLNMKGTHAALRNYEKTDDYSDFVDRYTHYVSAAANVSRKTNGVIENVSGDRITMSFNATLPNLGHKAKACTACLQLRDACGDVKVSMGVASGEAVCGSMGCKGVKSVGICGEVIGTSKVLEVMARAGYGVCLADPVVEAVESFIEVKYLRFVRFKGQSQQEACNGNAVIAQLIAEKGNMGVEWMYAMRDSETTGHGKYNNAFSYLLQGLFTDALESLKQSPLPAEENAPLEERILHYQVLGTPPPPEEVKLA